MILLFLFGLAVLGCEIAYHAVLAHYVKTFLWLSIDRLPTIHILSTFRFWKKFLHGIHLSWLGWIPAIIFWFYYKAGEALSCAFCTSMWLGFLYSYIFTPADLITSIIYGGITVGFVYVVQLLDKLTHIK